VNKEWIPIIIYKLYQFLNKELILYTILFFPQTKLWSSLSENSFGKFFEGTTYPFFSFILDNLFWIFHPSQVHVILFCSQLNKNLNLVSDRVLCLFTNDGPCQSFFCKNAIAWEKACKRIVFPTILEKTLVLNGTTMTCIPKKNQLHIRPANAHLQGSFGQNCWKPKISEANLIARTAKRN